MEAKNKHIIVNALEILINEGYIEPSEQTFELALKRLGRIPRNKKEMLGILTSALDDNL